MAEFTKGEWTASKSGVGDWTIATKSILIAHVLQHFNAHLIVAAVNACQSVNPDNPRVVADSIKEVYEALEQIASCKSNVPGDVIDIAQKALAKVEGR
mgnify:CR=1 FL=1